MPGSRSEILRSRALYVMISSKLVDLSTSRVVESEIEESFAKLFNDFKVTNYTVVCSLLGARFEILIQVLYLT